MEAFPLGFDYFRQVPPDHRPKSLQGALRALHQGTSAPETVVVHLNGARSVFDEPWDLSAFDRALSRPHTSLREALALARIFRRLTADPDHEQALFGAESLNALEARFAGQSQAALRAYEEATDGQRSEALRACLRAQYRLAVVNRGRPAIVRFHCLECLRLRAGARSWFRLRLSDTLLLAAVYRELGRGARARALLEACRRHGKEHPRLDLLRADLAFREGDALGVYRTLAHVPASRLTPRLTSLRAFWGISTQGARE